MLTVLVWDQPFRSHIIWSIYTPYTLSKQVFLGVLT